jgi:hypothetical protein
LVLRKNMGAGNMEQQLQELLDRKACEDVLMRYGRTLDWLDQSGQEECFWPDAIIDYGFFRGTGKEWVPIVMEVEASSVRRWHVSTGVMVQVQGERAKSECYGLSLGTIETSRANWSIRCLADVIWTSWKNVMVSGESQAGRMSPTGRISFLMDWKRCSVVVLS